MMQINANHCKSRIDMALLSEHPTDEKAEFWGVRSPVQCGKDLGGYP